MANFDSDFWYQLFVNQNPSRGLIGTSLFNDGERGAVLFEKANSSHTAQRWQFHEINSTTFVLRTQDGGADGYLAAFYNSNETTPGQTRPRMIKNTLADESVYWTVTPWGDGTFFLTNGANGTAWHLMRKVNGGLVLSSNLSEPHDGQRWTFKAWQGVNNVNNARYSTINLPFASATGTAVPTNGASTTGSPTSSGSGGLSTGAQAAIGASIGGVALIALIVGLLWFLRRRKQKAPYMQQAELPTDPPTELAPTTVKYEMMHENAVKHEMPAQAAEAPPVELPGNTVAPYAR
ncbi:hypothetical protein BDV96DRAFT_602024 [Lophiotrema nucula]|uniref:Uncharacterized protein n=1 Tax=Lophiotrema nucula TaxID=690887 RepID=A0A6A5YZP1_9PLEO|nr:hypothetical protein BDV96DRAFT_602024 [Lophiotrema nucula]